MPNIKQINSTIKLRRDNDYNYEKVGDKFIPARGEVCLVDTINYGLRIKIGDGINSYNQLVYSDNNNNIILIGYYLNNKFYTDSTYTTELEKSQKHIYIDKNAKSSVYISDGDNYYCLTPEATENIAGIMKLYETSGNNIDGTMTQKAITDGVNSIKFVLDDEDKECLTLDLPWD